jgi:hypothetical protein
MTLAERTELASVAHSFVVLCAWTLRFVFFAVTVTATALNPVNPAKSSTSSGEQQVGISQRASREANDKPYRYALQT